jgi:hypothetical protein
MASNHLEDLVAEWYEWNGFFVRRNVQVGKRKSGGYDCELDVVAFHPQKKKLIQIEPSLDADSWAKREDRYKKKFDAGRKHIPTLFSGFDLPSDIEQIAIFLFAGRNPPETIGGGKIVAFHAFMDEIRKVVSQRPLTNAMIPEQYGLLRTLQFAARTWPISEEERHLTIIGADGAKSDGSETRPASGGASGDKAAELRARIENMQQRRIAVADTIKKRHAELQQQTKQIETEIRALDENWEPPR